MAQLAIKGHATRGKEVIEILEMLGGKNRGKVDGKHTGCYYIIREFDNIIIGSYASLNEYKVFTLEEFFEKFPYKIGDKVIAPESHNIHTIESMHWDGDKIYYNTVGEGFNTSYTAKDLQPYKEETMEELRMDFPEGYCYAGIENKQVIFTKIKPHYPKTYEECCEVLSYEPDRQTVTGYDAELIENLQTLKLCRDAYWKIAGDWKPEFRFGKKKYCIMTKDNKVIKATVEETNRILVFSTEEMRDAFYEGFKDLIEQCKELL